MGCSGIDGPALPPVMVTWVCGGRGDELDNEAMEAILDLSDNDEEVEFYVGDDFPFDI